MLPQLRLTPRRAIRHAVSLCLTALLALAASAQTTRNVGQGQTYTTIQSAIDASANGDTVLVYPGTYYENIDFKGKAITVASTPAPAGGAANTIIDGGTKAPTVVFMTNEPRVATLNGFTIQNGGPNPRTGGTSSLPPAGIFVGAAAPTITQNVITHNQCEGIYSEGAPLIQANEIDNTLDGSGTYKGVCSFGGGSAILLWEDLLWQSSTPMQPIILGNLIQNNTQSGFEDAGGNGGAGVAVWIGLGIIENNIIRNNVTGGQGGGIHLEGNGGIVIGNLIYNNVAGGGGGGIDVNGFDSNFVGYPEFNAFIANNTFANNTYATGLGGSSNDFAVDQVYFGSYGFIGPSFAFVNNIVAGGSPNPAVQCGWDISGVSNDALVLDHNLFFNAGGPTFTSFCADPTGTFGNITADPRFVNAGSGNFALAPGSPAIDAGNNGALGWLTDVGVGYATDQAGNRRLADATGKGYPTIDIGALEAMGLPEQGATTLVLTANDYQQNAGANTPLSIRAFSPLGTPSGTVTVLEDGSNPVGSATLDGSGNATLNVALTPGVHRFVAQYPGQGIFSSAFSVEIVLIVSKYQPTITLTPTANPSLFGQPVTFTVRISSPDSVPLSPVSLTFGNTAPISLTPDATGAATYTATNLPLGYTFVQASYGGDSTHNGATASLSQQVLTAIATTTTLTSSTNPSTYAQPVTFTATVTAQTGTSIPSGAILFSDGHTTLATIPLDASGIATFPTSALTANDLGTSAYHQIAAVFVPAAGFATSSASLNQVVNGLPSVAALTVTPGSGTPSTSFTLTAAVSSGTTSSATVPSGRVLFYTSTQTGVSGNLLGYADLTNGVATFTSKGFLGGTDYILAVYMGDTIYAQADSNYVSLTVTTPSTTTTAAVSPEPSTYGQPVVFSTHVTGTNGPTGVVPTGQVEFDYCHGARSVVTIDASGNSSYISTLPNTIAEPAGSCPFTAKYLGDANFPSSTSAVVPYIVLPSGSTTTLATSAANAYIGQPVTLTATIAGTPAPVLGPGGIILPPAAMQPTGTVAFTTHSATLGSATVTNGVATLVTTALPVGSSTVVATYAGDSDLTGSISGPITEIVTKPDFTLTAPQPAITIQSRHKSSMPLNFTSLTGFNGPITVSCVLPLPTWLTCEPPTVSLPLNGTATGTLTLDTDGVPNWYGDLRSPSNTTTGHGLATRSTLALTLLPLLGLASSRKRRRQQWLAIALIAVATLTLSSCANTLPQHTAAGTYTIQLQATGTSTNVTVPTTHAVSITLTVTPE
jgi:hypothetical protein